MQHADNLTEQISAETGPPPHILIVDDEPRIANSVRELLALRIPCRISVAYGGQDAIDKLTASLGDPEGPVDLVLLDIGMPLTNGQEVLRWIRATPTLSVIRVIMLTGMDDHRKMVQTLGEGADDYITKPYNINELLARVKTSLRSRALEKRLQYQRSQLALLNTLSNNITASFDRRVIIERCVQGVQQLLRAEFATFHVHESTHNLLYCQFVAHPPDKPVSADLFPPIAPGKGIISAAFTHGVTHCANDAPNDARFLPGIDAPASLEARHMLATPVYTNGRPAAVLVAINQQYGGFSPNDIDLFVSLATTFSQVMQNIWLIRKLTIRQNELLASRNTLQTLLDGILHPIYTINRRWEIVSVNQAKSEAEKDEPESLIGRPCYRTFFQRETPCEHCQVAALLATNQPQRWPVRWVGSDHLPREWEINAFPIGTGNTPHEARAVLIWQDRTDERRMETSLHQAAKLAAVGQLAAGVAHEINNPLTVIITGAEMLRDTLPAESAESEAHELVDWIRMAAQRAGKVVGGLLDFARQNRYEFKRGDVRQSIDETLELAAYQLRKHNITVEREFSAELPAVTASWEHLKTVWLNLLFNARDALLSREENRLVRIVVRPAPLNDHIVILFHDNGEGIPEEQVYHIFEPFYTTKAPGQGTGLGLAISYRIVDQHGGEINVTSTVGTGTTLVIRLPIGEEHQSLPFTPPQALPTAAEEP